MNSLVDAIRTLGPARLLATGLVLATPIAFFVVIPTRLTSPDMVLLYGDLAQTDAGQISSKLEAMGVPYELKANGTIIHVPSSQVLRLRMESESLWSSSEASLKSESG